jgi:hypothetical protein
MVAAWLSKPSVRLLLVALVVVGILAPLPTAVALILVGPATVALGASLLFRSLAPS